MFFMPCCVDRPTMRFLELSWLVRYSMRNKALVFVAVLLGACSSQTASLTMPETNSFRRGRTVRTA
jgi:hypothetical protein